MKYTEPIMELIVLPLFNVIRTSDGKLDVYPEGDDQEGSWGGLK